jgi:TPR repeat protein
MGFMETQEAANLIAALAGVACIGFGIFALFKGLKADGAIEFSDLSKGRCGLAGAGVLLLLFGTIITTAFILHGNDQPRVTTTLPHESNTAIVVHRDPTPPPIEKLPKAAKSDAPVATPAPAVPKVQPPEIPEDRFQPSQNAANSEDPKALYELGIKYAVGIPGAVTRDMNKAVEYFRMAADKDYAPAKRELGECYLNGKGVPKDEAKGLKMLRGAAAAKDPGAMSRLGAYLARADSARPNSARKEDYQEAFALLSESRAMGDLDSLASLGAMYMNGYVPGLHDPDFKKGVALFAEGAHQGNMHCMYSYGLCLESGIGIKQNQLEAANWMRKAAGLGSKPAAAWCRAHSIDLPSISPASLQVPSGF